MPKTILISIHPEYAEKILTGEKAFELRRRLPLEKPERMVIYATAPISAVVGTAEVADMIDLPLSELWKHVRKSAFVTLSEFHEYFRPQDRGKAFVLSNPERFLSPIPITEYGLKRAPQSWQYLPEESDAG